MLKLRYDTPSTWTRAVLDDFDTFLQDHAANERKVSGSAMTLVRQHPTLTEMCDALIDVALEELEHFRAVYALLRERGVPLAQDAPDPYMGAVRKLVRADDVETFLMDRLILFGIVEARGCERFGMVARGVGDPKLATFYADLERSEARHHGLYHRLARTYYPEHEVDARADALLDAEAAIVEKLPIRAALH